MSIKALPGEATRLLDASSLIANPVSLVKELVDNAIDAHATSIEVLIAPNTVDKIEVRDNGHGILRSDFDLLGRPGHTSKLTCLDDLHTRPSDEASLGFRGQGLAAAATLGYVAITTRTRADSVAASFRLAPGSTSGSNSGGIVGESLKPAPNPVGTSITVTCLFSSLPVRRRAATQDSAKAVAAIKALLYGYALARPQLRLGFKVFQKPELTWNYSHRSTQQMASTEAARCSMEMREATRVLFGNEVARQCQDVVVSAVELFALSAGGSQRTLAQTLAQTLSGDDAIRGLVFEALLPQPGADLSKLAAGGFVSVDGRPLSAHHRGGIVGKLLALFRAHLARSTASEPHQQRHIRDAFMRLNIRCPADSYDPNVEPSKTDVLFGNQKLLCDAFERLCVRLYGAVEPERSQTQASATTRTRHTTGGQSNLRQSSVIGMSLRSAVTPYNSPATSAREQHGSSAELVRQRLRPGTTSSRPGSGARRREFDAQRHPNPTVRPRRERAALGLQTPPPSSPLQHHQGGRRGRARRSAESPDHVDLPGLVSTDAYRQTTISFGKPAEAMREQRAALGSNVSSSAPISGVDGIAARPQEFMTATEFQSGQDAAMSTGTRVVETAVQESNNAAFWNEAGVQTTTSGDKSQKTRWQAATRKPVYVLETDLARLRRGFARSASAGDWEGEYVCLSPDMVDISAVKRRLKQAMVGWLAKTRANREGGMPVEIEYYLKRGLKGKAKR